MNEARATMDGLAAEHADREYRVYVHTTIVAGRHGARRMIDSWEDMMTGAELDHMARATARENEGVVSDGPGRMEFRTTDPMTGVTTITELSWA